ncbi:hypothetical protein JCM10212_002874 [Sporobolomyces blumeae]
MADDSTLLSRPHRPSTSSRARTMTPPGSATPPSPAAPTPAEAVVRGWRSSLRQQSAPTPPNVVVPPLSRGGAPARSSRPPSGVSSNRLSSNPSLLSLEQPLSPATTVDYHPSRYSNSSTSLPPPLPSPRGGGQASAYAHSSSQQPPNHARRPAPPHQFHGRHHAQLAKVYDSKPARYDADFDRSLPTTTASSSAAPATLFDPNAPAASQSNASLSNGGNGNAHQAERRRERELREDGTVRRPRSKRDVVDPADLGRRAGGGGAGAKESKDSLESVETDFSGRTKSSSGARRRRRRGDDAGDEPEAADGGGASRRQLFDPRRDDPVRFVNANNSFASLPNPSTIPSRSAHARASAAADNRSIAGQSIASFNSGFSGVSDGTGIDVDDSVSINTHHSRKGGSSDPATNPALAGLKRAYREICELEKKVQDEHRAAVVAKEREDDGQASKGIRLHGAQKNSNSGRFDDEYWVKLAQSHKQLADAHYSFLQLALDPRLPPSHHTLPQKYNIPTRLWQTGFHQLLERMRHAVLSSPVSSEDSPSANVLEHLIEFIQSAYGFYSQLFEDPTVAMFRSAWIEQLGDLARYRMAVAGLASRVHAAQQQATQRESQQHLSSAALNDASTAAEASTPVRREDEASIGQAALNDWDLEEQETWREMAKDWYAQGVSESPGTGRLQHHLALLSKGEGDELKGLYHYVKSLTATNPYVSARESILPLFDQEHQSRRTLPEVAKSELFVHLHGMLFTKISLDDFDDCLERFLERLQEEGWAIGKGVDSHGPDSSLYGDKEWFMLAIVNIASMMQYGAEDGILKKLTTKEPVERDRPNHSSSRSNGQHRHAASQKVAPQAIMLNTARQQADDDAENDVVKRLTSTAPTSVDEDPLPFKLAQRLSFRLFEFALAHPIRQIGTSALANPYLVLLLTFLGHMSFESEALKHLERSIPWDALADFFNLLPPTLEIRLETPSKLMSSRGTPLPEDWCVRGMEWAGKQLFGRGYWRTDTKKGPRSGAREYAESMLPPPIEGVDGTTMRVESESDALKFDLAAIDDDEGTANEEDGLATAAVISEARWRRFAITAAWLVRNVPGFDYNPHALGDEPRFTVSGPLKAKVERWKREDEEAKEAERLSQMTLNERGLVSSGEDDGKVDESEDEDDEDENDTPAVKELKARRRQLKAVIRSAQVSTNGHSRSRLRSRQAALPTIFPGYTVLVFDTNILLTSIKLFSELVEAECWTIVVPLAVITELDGLKRNPTPLGLAASEVIDYLEVAIRTHARFLKIQTSRGNYLKDLAIRNESIDFGPSFGDDAHFSSDYARNMDDVILRAVTWQKDHFTSRLGLVNPRAIQERKKIAPETAQVVLVTFDRNLRLKGRARGLDALDEKELKKSLEAALVAG